MKPVLDCLLALKERSMINFGSSVSKAADERRKALSDPKYQRACSPLSPGWTHFRSLFLSSIRMSSSNNILILGYSHIKDCVLRTTFEVYV